MKRSSLIASVLLVASSALVAFNSLAGLKTSTPVVIVGTTSGSMSGQLGSARNSANNVEFIKCSVLYNIGGTRVGTCSARDSAGNTRSCTSSLAPMVDLMLAVSDDGYLHVYYSNGACYDMITAKASNYMPKLP